MSEKQDLLIFGNSVSLIQYRVIDITSSLIKSNVEIDTYHDPRMAMSFTPLSVLMPIKINDPQVVSKSYVCFWDDLEKLGFKISKINR